MDEYTKCNSRGGENLVLVTNTGTHVTIHWPSVQQISHCCGIYCSIYCSNPPAPQIFFFGGSSMLADIQKTPRIAVQALDIFHANAMILNSKFVTYIGITIRIRSNACIDQFLPKCHFKVQSLNNCFALFSVTFLNIMRRSSRKCLVVINHGKLITTSE